MVPQRVLTIIALVAVSTPVLAQAAPAGRIKVASGAVFIVRAQTATAAKIGDIVYESDILRTGADGHLGVTLKDETRVSLGPSSEVRLDRFLYSPAEGQFAFVLRVFHGIAAYVSGRIAKLSPDAVRLETPTAIVGIRGTRVLIKVASQ